MSAFVHPTAIVEDGAELADGVKIGPFCHVGSEVVLGSGVELVSHAVVAGRTSIGDETRIFPFASVGHQPQDLKYHGEESRLVIGKRCPDPRERHRQSGHGRRHDGNAHRR